MSTMRLPPVLRNRDFDRYWAAVILSQIGTRGTVAANFYHVYALSDSVAYTGLVGAAQAIALESVGRGSVASHHESEPTASWQRATNDGGRIAALPRGLTIRSCAVVDADCHTRGQAPLLPLPQQGEHQLKGLVGAVQLEIQHPTGRGILGGGQRRDA